MSGRGRQFYLLNQGKPIVTGGGCVTHLTPCGKRQTGDENLLTLQKNRRLGNCGLVSTSVNYE